MMNKRFLMMVMVSLMAAACSDDSENRRNPDEWDLTDDVSIGDDAGDAGDDLDAEEPDSDAPDAEVPDADAPDAEVPDADEPDADAPDADEPDADVPDADEPDADEPDADVPDADEPDADAPDADEPDADVPDADEPDTDVPDADEPDVDPAATCVEIWSDGSLVGEDFDFGVQSEATTETFEIRLCAGAEPTRVDSLEIEGDAYALSIGSTSGWPARIEEGQTLSFSVTFNPYEANLSGELVVGVIDAPGEFRFGLTGELQELSPECPVVTPQAAPSFTAVAAANPAQATGGLFDLSVDGPYAEARFSVQWFVVETPAGATTPVFYDRSDEAPTRVHLEELGAYVIGLKLHDETLDLGCATELLPVEVIESPFGANDAVVTLTWENPNIPNPGQGLGTDMDIYFCHQDGQLNGYDSAGPWCVFWNGVQQIWHNGNVALVIDDVWGETGEVISQEVALPGFVYRVGVHYYEDRGYGNSTATVKLYQRGIEAYSQSRSLIHDNFWRPFNFDPAVGVIPVDSVQIGVPTQP
ncbi:hypothetical protein FRC98_14320 [Lujinxingia vulgaris]|uniref:Uncharacterized protein n=1 Tax=Lujinxingia vulgaris TaxID=2600176 RepID=A0A5C6X404_9DELT|nr:hypothetical protein [Lujinxingia vulgaris]TXD35847.1 hypothetical protein FRC98_14320 [Lujinxingia vulgaris]